MQRTPEAGTPNDKPGLSTKVGLIIIRTAHGLPIVTHSVYLEVYRHPWETEQRPNVSWLAWAAPSSLLYVWPVLPAQPLCGCLHKKINK